jgi:predicted N-acetyltransferase YhbS
MPNPSAVHTTEYNSADIALRQRIAELQRSVFGSVGTVSDAVPEDHAAGLNAIAFFALEGDQVVSYAAVVHLTIAHGGRTFALAGLSAVATAPEFRGRGLGTAVVAAATRHIESSDADLAIFTSDRPLARFYERAGGWRPAPQVRVVGSLDEGALTSDGLGKVVLMRLLSDRARAAADLLTHGTINLGLPVGEFL